MSEVEQLDLDEELALQDSAEELCGGAYEFVDDVDGRGGAWG